MCTLLFYSLLSLLAFFDKSYQSEIIESSRYFEIKDDKLVRTDSVTLQINDRTGDKDAFFAFDYVKGEKLDIVYAQIEDTNGNVIRKLKKNEIKDQSYISNMSFYEDDFIKTFELKHHVYPYRISYSIKKTTPKFLQVLSMNLQYLRIPIRKAKITVISPAESQLLYKQKELNEPQIISSGVTTQYIWEYSYTPIEKTEVNANYSDADIPTLKVQPLNFNYGKKGSWESWESFGNWIYRLNEGRDKLPEIEKEKVNTLLNGISSNREKAKALYRYLQQEVRYINVKIDIGGLQTYPAEYVCKNRYGDCKALSNYMQALLKQAGIQSFYTLINAGGTIESIDPGFPSQEFNHVILTIPFENDTVFLECTDKNLPFGYVHSSIQGRNALLVKESGSELILLPSMKPEDVLCSRTIEIKSNEVKLSAKQRGEHFEESMYLMNGANKNAVDKYIRNSIFSSGSYNLVNYSITKENPDDAEIDFEALIEMENLYKKYGSNLVITPFPVILPNYETPENRYLGVQLDYPLFYKDEISYEMPENTTFKLPENIELTTDYGYYKLYFSLDNNNLTVLKSIQILSGKYPLDNYQEFYNFVMKIKNYETKNINIELL